jgi:hypothetical protein
MTPPLAFAPNPPRHRRLTAAQRRLLHAVLRAGALMRTDTAAGPCYALPNGPPAHRRTVDSLIRAGWLVGNADSLFGAPPQTYRARAKPPPLRQRTLPPLGEHHDRPVA